MKRFLVTTMLSALVIGAGSASVGAQVPSPAGERAWSAFVKAVPGTWRSELAPSGDRVSALRGLSEPLPGTPQQAAETFLTSAREVLGIDRSDLKLVSERTATGDHHLTYQQTIGDRPVFNGFVDLALTGDNRVYLVLSRHAPGLSANPQAGGAAIGTAEAVRIARTAAGRLPRHDLTGKAQVVAPVSASKPELGYQLVEGVPRLAYRVVVGAIRVTIDATSGVVIEAVSLKVSANGTGKIFDPNPVFRLNDGSLTDNDDHDYAALADAYSPRTLRSLHTTGRDDTLRYRLIGPYVKAIDVTAATGGGCLAGEVEVRKAPPVRSDGDFNYKRSQLGFEHVMAYYHIDRSQRYIQTLGFTDLWKKQIRVDAHGMEARNAFYCPSPAGDGYLSFGDGGVDSAEDADVILHEYGHALQDGAKPGGYPSSGEAGAMGEGFGDYWAFTAHTASRWSPCLGEWFNEGTCLRRLDRNKMYPRDLEYEVHADGEIWSRGLRDLLLALGKEKADKIILKSHYLVPSQPTFSDGLQALLDADTALYTSADHDAICSAFVRRGIGAPGCGLWIQLTWNKTGADVDLHLRPPSAAGDTAWNNSNDVAFYNMNPDWGEVGNAEDDPKLYHDCISDCTYEQITVSKLVDPGTYRVMVHYYSDHGLGSAMATVRVYQGSTLTKTALKTLTSGGDPGSGTVWFVDDITVRDEPSSAGAGPRITVVDRVVKTVTRGKEPPRKPN